MNSRLVVTVLAVAVFAVGCGDTGARADPPDVMDEWLPPVGVDLDSDRLYRENRDLFNYDTGAPLDIEQAGTERSGDVNAIDLTYASPKGGRVPATLFVPDGDGPLAGLVLMHGLPSNRTEMSEYAMAFALLDAVVITIDAPFARPENKGREPLTYTDQDRDEQIQLIVDLRRAIDVLVSRPEVDPDRMAYVGVSYGGAMGGLLAGVEDRLRTYVLQVGDGGLVTHSTASEDRSEYFYTGLSASGREAWLEAMWPIEPIHYVGHAAPAALLFQNGTVDDLVPPADALRYQEAGSQPKAILWYEAGHGVSPTAADDTVAWLQDHGALGQLRASAPARWIDRGLLVWSALTVGSLLYLLLVLRRDRTTPWGSMLVWVLAVLFFGPLGLVAYLYLFRRPRQAGGPGADIPTSGRAVGSTMWSAAGNLVAVFVIALSNSFEPALVLLLPLATGFLAYQLSRLPKGQDHPWTTHTQPLTVQILSTNLTLVGAYVLLPFALDRFERWYPFGEPLRAVWAVLVLGSVAAVLTGYPIHRWMVGRGLVRWGPDTGDSEQEGRSLSRSRALGLILATLAVLVAVVQGATTLAD
ncbi:MAG: prolyl oligopeptidase family serine peptidase [Acidimicrobiia bacterium]|nr:prolyl oligopeptidase family serine peptidase [Acidimicrobiia bacterium]